MQKWITQLAIVAIMIVTASLAVPPAFAGNAKALYGSTIIVYRSHDDFTKAWELREAGIAAKNPAAFLKHVSCIVKPDTALVRTKLHWLGTMEILVADGAQVGCRGVIQVEEYTE